MADQTQTPPPASPSSELSGKGFFSNLGEHKVMLIGAIVGILFVVYIIAKGRSTATPSTTSGGPVDNSGQSAGSLGNAGYQDSGVAYGLTQLGQQLNNLTAQMNQQPTTNPSPTPNPTPGGAIIPAGLWPSGVPWVTGQHVSYGGQNYTAVIGEKGRIWGVPGVMTAQQALTVKGAPLLYQVPNWSPLTNSQAAHSPIVSFLPLNRMADKNFDLSNSGVAARSGLAISSHPGLALQFRS